MKNLTKRFDMYIQQHELFRHTISTVWEFQAARQESLGKNFKIRRENDDIYIKEGLIVALYKIILADIYMPLGEVWLLLCIYVLAFGIAGENERVTGIWLTLLLVHRHCPLCVCILLFLSFVFCILSFVWCHPPAYIDEDIRFLQQLPASVMME